MLGVLCTYRLTACLDDVCTSRLALQVTARTALQMGPRPLNLKSKSTVPRAHGLAAVQRPGTCALPGPPTALELELRFVGPFLSGARAKSGEALVGARRM